MSQQASYIRTHTALSVGEYVGELGVDSWGVARWNSELRQNNILVMTRQIFLDMLQHKFLHISQVNLLIFDECHHAVKKDPYVQIMRIFDQCPKESQPHVLGLSASIVSGKCKPEKLPERLRQLEATLHCRIETARDLEEVARYATNPDEVIHTFSAAHSTLMPLQECFTGLPEFIQASKGGGKKDVYSGFVNDVLYALENVSISGAKEAAEMTQRMLQETIEEGWSLTEWDKQLTHLLLTKLSVFTQRCKEFLEASRDDHSPKLTLLLQIIADTSPIFTASHASASSSTSASIIFVERRTAAVCLASLIQRLSVELPHLHHIKCAHMVGHGAGGSVLVQGKSSCMNVKRQQEVLRKFRSGEINLLVATSVVEEGLDVRKCNLVIRYDFPKTFQSYVQSQGRARAKESKYILLVEESMAHAHREKLLEYRDLARSLQELCHRRPIPGEDEIEQAMKQLIPPYKPFGVNGPQISIDSSLSLVHK